MSIDRVFLDWGRSALHRVADYLAQDHRQAGQFDLGGVIVAVPGGRAGRRFLEVLVEWAERKRCALVPPRIVTVGRLPEMLYQARKPFASHLVQQLAWVQAVRGCDSAVCRQFLPSLPDGSNLADSLALGDMLARLHRELAADALDFHAVADCGVRLPGFREQARWQALAEIQRQYLQALDLLDLWDLQTARLFAIRHGECRTDARIVLGDRDAVEYEERVPGEPQPVRADVRTGREIAGVLVGHAPATTRWEPADQDLRELFEASNVKLVLQGHVHIREQFEYNGIRYITSGAVSGSWWNGPRYGHPEGYATVSFSGEDFTWTYHTYGWVVKQQAQLNEDDRRILRQMYAEREVFALV